MMYAAVPWNGERERRAMGELKPCPFCGGKLYVSHTHGGHYWWCGCGVESGCLFGTEEDAIKAANKRADDPLKERVCETLKHIMPEECYAGEAKTAADCDGCELRDGCDRHVVLRALAEWQGEAGE